MLTIGAGISVAQTARPAHTSLAILDPEIIGDSPGRDTRALADGIDADLAENLARQPSLVIVDRQSIDSILAEQALQKMTQSSATAVAALRAAGALLCTRIDIKSRTVIIEAVSAQSGGLLASVYAQLPGTTDHDILTTVQTRTKNLAQQIADTAAAQQGKPTLEISARLTSAQSRIAWMADDLSETFGAKITAGNSVTLLTPRQPLYTKE
ncbi:MAG TPA: hypothetical protein VHY37_01075, partial [Tepidisphaeraceae bacterium]|nr:hypothetical protein [Tepidisphaeraceae bacterium]